MNHNLSDKILGTIAIIALLVLALAAAPHAFTIAAGELDASVVENEEDMPTWVDRAWERITRGLIEDEDEEPNGSTTKR